MKIKRNEKITKNHQTQQRSARTLVQIVVNSQNCNGQEGESHNLAYKCFHSIIITSPYETLLGRNGTGIPCATAARSEQR